MLLLCTALVSCDSGSSIESNESDSGKPVEGKPAANGTVMLSFSQAQSIEEMKNYDGREVTIIGYMSTLSPISVLCPLPSGKASPSTPAVEHTPGWFTPMKTVA